MFKKEIGVIGMSVMGKNLAINIANHGYNVSIFNRSPEKTKKVFINNVGKKLFPYYNIKHFVNSLKKPRCILLMIQAGKSIDEIIELLKPFLEKGDILIDGGNTFYKDTIRRFNELSIAGFNFIGMGISGGEIGALTGPSLMPGGDKYVYKIISPILKKIAAYSNNQACVTYIGPDGSGHYVKMIHNGIEYGDMQLIAEIYTFLKNVLGLKNKQLYNIFSKWNEGEIKSYLIHITKNIFVKKDEEGNFILDSILDKAMHKGTGSWISRDSLDLEEPLSLITESVFSRYLSMLKDQRMLASKILFGPISTIFKGDITSFIEKARCALYLGKIISYAQGFSQLKAASKKYNWNLNYAKISKIFRAGCIIQSEFLQNISDAYTKNTEINNILTTPYFKIIANKYQQPLRDIVAYAIKSGVPMPAFASAISYYDSYRSAVLPANLIQAQRDYFGAHTYERIDKKGSFHTEW